MGWSIALRVLIKPSTLVPFPGSAAEVCRIAVTPMRRLEAIIRWENGLAKRFSAARAKLVELGGPEGAPHSTARLG